VDPAPPINLRGSVAPSSGFHVAPQTPAGTAANVRTLSGLPHRPVVTVDILSDELIDRRLYADLGFLRGASAFLPSEAEIVRIWEPRDIGVWLRETASRLKCRLVAKLGERGSLVCDAERDVLIHTPAHPVNVVDATGGWRWLLRRVRRGSRGGPAARRMRCYGGRIGVPCRRSLRSARKGTAERRRSSGCLERLLAETRYEKP
jgi:hypothetical protein